MPEESTETPIPLTHTQAADGLERDAGDNIATAGRVIAERVEAEGKPPEPGVLLLGAVVQGVLAISHRLAALNATTAKAGRVDAA